MTDNPINLAAFREQRDASAKSTRTERALEGDARCLACGHEWRARVAYEVETDVGFEGDLECPSCRCMRGQFIWPFFGPPDELIWSCRCSGVVFTITTVGTRCINCGRHQAF